MTLACAEYSNAPNEISRDWYVDTATFGVVDAMPLRPSPYSEADRTVWMGGRARNGDEGNGITPTDFLDDREQDTGFAQCRK